MSSMLFMACPLCDDVVMPMPGIVHEIGPCCTMMVTPGAIMILFALSIFLSAFLLFQVEPMIGKFILPWFGGTPAVWSTLMLLFQVLLTGGYAYAHWLIRQLKWQSLIHLALL